MEFDFEAWAKLAKEDPDAFEREREAALRAFIAAAPAAHRQRLEGLQSRLNLERRRARTPLGACVQLNSLMWTGFHRLRRELRSVSQGSAPEKPSGTSAKIIELPVRQGPSRGNAR
jgi:hypothetical protein